MLLNFQRQFARDVIDGRKRQTIRKKGRRAPIPGEWAHCYTGLRVRGATVRLGCWRIRVVLALRMRIDATGVWDVEVGGRRLSFREIDDMARADGFADTWAMCKWFAANHAAGVFEGWVIRWDWLPVAPAPVLPWEKP